MHTRYARLLHTYTNNTLCYHRYENNGASWPQAKTLSKISLYSFKVVFSQTQTVRCLLRLRNLSHEWNQTDASSSFSLRSATAVASVLHPLLSDTLPPVPVLAFPLYRYKLPLCHQSADVRVTYEFSQPSICGAELKTQAWKNEITAQAWLTHHFWFTYNRAPRAVLSPLHHAAFPLNALV